MAERSRHTTNWYADLAPKKLRVCLYQVMKLLALESQCNQSNCRAVNVWYVYSVHMQPYATALIVQCTAGSPSVTTEFPDLLLIQAVGRFVTQVCFRPATWFTWFIFSEAIVLFQASTNSPVNESFWNTPTSLPWEGEGRGHMHRWTQDLKTSGLVLLICSSSWLQRSL